MGSSSAMSSINRVLEAHGQELVDQQEPCKPGTKLTFVKTELENKLYGIGVLHVFKTSKGESVYVSGEPIDIDDLAEMFPDCEVGY